jgi:hypothetical protein
MVDMKFYSILRFTTKNTLVIKKRPNTFFKLIVEFLAVWEKCYATSPPTALIPTEILLLAFL